MHKFYGETVFFLLLFATVVSSSSAVICTTICGQGQFCDKDDCRACPEGSYQDDKTHENTVCKRWSDKPNMGSWIIEHKGSATQDQTYRCADGYKRHQYTVGEWECLEVEPAKPASSSTMQPSVNITSTETSVSPKPDSGSNESDTLSVGAIVGICIGGIVTVALLFGVGYKICKKKSNLLEKRKREEYFDTLVEEIGPNDSEKLLQLLRPGSIDVNTTLQSAREKYGNDPRKYYTYTFLKWSKAESDYKEKLEEAKQQL